MATNANSTRVSAREVMSRAWANYRAYLRTFGGFARPAFSRAAFAEALAMAWSQARTHARQEAERARLAAEEAAALAAMADETDAEPSPMEQEIAALSYLPFGMSAARAEAAIRARYAAMEARV